MAKKATKIVWGISYRFPQYSKTWTGPCGIYYMRSIDLKEREKDSCTPKEQAGDYWDEEKQCDSRFTKED